MKKVKTIIKNNIFGFILGGLIFGTVGVYAATYCASSVVSYDNSKSGLKSTDVQSAIDELYENCSSIKSGDNIYYLERTGNYDIINKKSISSGTTTTVYRTSSGNISEMDVSNGYIYYVEKTLNFDKIYKVSTNGGNASQIFSTDNDTIINMNVQGEYIYYIERTLNYDRVYRLSINGGNASQIFSARNDTIEQIYTDGC